MGWDGIYLRHLAVLIKTGKDIIKECDIACSIIHDKSKSMFRRYITEYCPVLEGVYTRVLNVAGLEVSSVYFEITEMQFHSYY